jgi:hypothetical protein
MRLRLAVVVFCQMAVLASHNQRRESSIDCAHDEGKSR